jgi:hypothetical protein
MLRTKLLIISFLLINCAYSQTKKPTPSLSIKKAKGKIILDGEINEPDWQTAQTAGDFFQIFPSDTSYSKTKTEVRVTYDAEFLYIAAICFDDIKGNYVVQSLKRDFSYPANDAFAVYIDPINDKTNGFCFGVSPMGVQREGLISNGGGQGVTTIWDSKWFSEVKKYDDKWVVEIAIPFKTLRYKSGISNWRINFSRNDLKRNENSSWAPVPKNFNVASLAFTGDLYWDEAPKKTGPNIAIIPYLTGSSTRDYTDTTQKDALYKYNGGLDAKIAISSSLNLDITINPDFSQVEVDRQVTTLSRFSIFFPERRAFFIENSDLFDRFGFSQIRPFFSRKIGLYKGNVIPIIGGFRLSGNINKKWRIGIMNIQTEHKHNLGLEPQNYTVAAISRNVFKRSNVAVIFVNRQEVTSKEINYASYNRIIGIDYNLQSKNNKWLGKAFYHKAFMPNQKNQSSANATFLSYSSPKFSFEWNHEYVEKNYLAEIGFVPRIYNYNPSTGAVTSETYLRFEPSARYKFYPKSKIINNHYIEGYLSNYMDSSLTSTEYINQLGYYINFQNASNITIKGKNNYSKLRYPLDITFTGQNPIPSGNYYYDNITVSYTSSSIKRLFGNATIDYGTFYNGTKLSYSGEIDFRKQPWGIFALSFTQNEIYLPAPFSNAYITLIGPRIELSFTKNIFFTTFVQYNTQIQNVNINSRLQWRFKPMSDLYIVYTDNYDSYNFGKKNRALVVKLIYWLNI